MPHLLANISPAEVIGVIGFCLYVTNYCMLTTRVLTGNCITYFVVNLCAAGCVLIGLTASFNLASVMIQVFFIVLSLIGIVLRLRRPRRIVMPDRREPPLLREIA